MVKPCCVKPFVVTPMGLTLFLTVALMWLLLVFNEQMSIMYMFMILSYYIWFKNDSNITFPIEKSHTKRFYSLLVSIVSYSIFLIIISLLIASFQPSVASGSTIGMGSVLEMQASSTPILQDNKILTVLVWGMMIPIIETVFFFAILFEGLAHHLGKFMFGRPIDTKFNLTNPNLWMVVILIAVIFTGYHFQAKGIHNSMALFITFIFAIVSMWMVSFFKQAREAVAFHMATNLMAVLSRPEFGMFALVLIGANTGGAV